MQSVVETHFALLCRVGFEPDLIDELQAFFAGRGQQAIVGSAQAAVVWVRTAGEMPPLSSLVFARDLLRVEQELTDLDVKDRVTPLAQALDLSGGYSLLSVLTPDSDATKPLSPLVNALEARLRAKASAAPAAAACVWMLSGTHALVGRPATSGAAAFLGGIPRLKFPREAPSRSTLKLDEAFQVLLNETERRRLLRAGGQAVDLGAAPGGWTYQLVIRQLRVTAIDNGSMDARLLNSGLVQHLREDGFRYRPAKPVDWLVCDMVEKPDRVAELVARWFAAGWCKAAVFNLKLPMKRRYQAWIKARALLDAVLISGFELRARQLYHDREEITVAIVPVGTTQRTKNPIGPAPARSTPSAPDSDPRARGKPALGARGKTGSPASKPQRSAKAVPKSDKLRGKTQGSSPAKQNAAGPAKRATGKPALTNTRARTSGRSRPAR